jgi:hypothetical protein
MANTLIQLKHSTVTAVPPSLNTAEPAYSYTSNTLFIGLNGAVINIGGQYYTSQIDNATSSATGNTLVIRDADGSASFNVITANTINATIEGNAASATKLQTARFFKFTGDVDNVSVSFDGTANADFTLELTNTGVASGTYGSATQIPVITVDEDGRVTAANTANIATTLALAADGSTTANISLLSETLTFDGGDGITTTANDSTNTIRVDVDNTVIRTTGNQTITGDLGITGNLNVTGNVVTVGAEDLVINDPIIVLANNNTMNIMDIGYVGKYADNGDQKELGLIHHAATNKFYLFTGYEGAVEDTNLLNIADPTLVTATIVANLEGGTVSNLTSAITVPNGGTGANTFSAGSIVIGNGTGALQVLANTTSAGTYANASHIPVISVDNYGRVSAVTNTSIAISAAQITSGTLGVARGGTGANTFSAGSIVIGNGTGELQTLANTSSAGTYANASHVPVITVDNYGRVSSVTNTSIAISATQITSGTLGVARGGTGATTFTTNGVLLGQGTSAVSTVSSSTQGHILTINASGVPVFEMLSGGTF